MNLLIKELKENKLLPSKDLILSYTVMDDFDKGYLRALDDILVWIFNKETESEDE